MVRIGSNLITGRLRHYLEYASKINIFRKVKTMKVLPNKHGA